LLRRNRYAQVGVILLPRSCLGLDAAGAASPADAVTLVIPMICVPIWWLVGVIGVVGSHRTSQSLCEGSCSAKRTVHDNK
jgi:hypothetical protein